MRSLRWACLWLALLPGVALAQSTAEQIVPGYFDAGGKFHQNTFVLNGFGSLTLSATTSTLLSTLTANSTGAVWPSTATKAPPGPAIVFNWTAGILYVCPLGGTCSASGATEGMQITAGNAFQFPVMTSTATVYAASSGAIQVSW